MTKAKPVECAEPLHAVVEKLYAKGATPANIVAALADAAIKVSWHDVDHAAAQGFRQRRSQN
jgi:hypothetical protein